MIRLELPDAKYESSFRRAVPLFATESNASIERYQQIDLDDLDFEAYVRERIEEMTDPKPGRVACTEFWVIDEEGYAGRISLRHELNENLAHYGGHIGYDIVPDRRGRGYATEALKECLVHARELGLERVLLTCSDANIASRKAIERNGGVLESLDDTFDPPLRRYWITLA